MRREKEMEKADLEKRLARAARLVEVIEELHEKLAEAHAELTHIVAGEAPMGDLIKAFETAYDAVWSARYPGHYTWSYAKDRAQIKRLIRRIGFEDLHARAAVYLADHDPFYVKARHPFNLFVAGINRFVPEANAPMAAPVIDCQHTPLCQSDQEHTQKRLREVRA